MPAAPAFSLSAETVLERAAIDGDTGAQSELAILLFRSDRREEAMPWISLAAQAGEPRCQYLLGVALYNGDYLPRDEARARTLLAAAADAGIEPARAALAAIPPAPRTPSPPPQPPVVAQPAFRRDLVPISLVTALLRPLLAERLETLLPAAIERAVAEQLAAAQPSASNA